MTNKLEISRDALLAAANRLSDRGQTDVAAPLWEALAAPVVERQPCKTCNDTRMVDDGELTCSAGGIPYEFGPIKVVKDCPDCAEQPAPVALITAAPDCIKPELRSAWVDGWNSARTAQMNSRPAPAGMVLPDRFEEGRYFIDRHYRVGWNACLDKVKELNQ